jgi:hypothetical protein
LRFFARRFLPFFDLLFADVLLRVPRLILFLGVLFLQNPADISAAAGKGVLSGRQIRP